MAIVVPAAFPLEQAMGSAHISYRQPIIDGSVTSMLIDAPTWAYASGNRVAWEWALGDDSREIIGSIAGPVETTRSISVLSSGRDEVAVSIYGTNADFTVTAETPGGAVQDTQLASTGAGAAVVTLTLTGLTAGFIVYRIVAESNDSISNAEISAFRFLEIAITAGDLP